MARAAIQAEGLGKRYRLGQGAYSYRTLRETLEARLRRNGSGSGASEHVWALRDVTLSIDEGEVVGIVGRNGAGKTTLLKTVARIVRPTTGLVRTRGRIGALLEVGTGFHPELTGRENIYLNGVLLGMSRREIARRFDEIVEFAGVARFLETPLKRYSSGMYLRLAFSVAAHVEPDVVVVDEVLAVGDAEFRKRCLGRMSELGSEGRTVLFVSHDLGSVAELCGRVVWIEQGTVRADGPTRASLDEYLRSVTRRLPRVQVPLNPGNPIGELSVALLDASGAPLDFASRDEPLSVGLDFVTREQLSSLDVAVYLLDRRRLRVLNENLSDGRPRLAGPPRSYSVSLTIPPVLAAGDYVLGVWMGTDLKTLVYQEVLEFSLLPRAGDSEESIGRNRVVQPVVDWAVTCKDASRAPA